MGLLAGVHEENLGLNPWLLVRWNRVFFLAERTSEDRRLFDRASHFRILWMIRGRYDRDFRKWGMLNLWVLVRLQNQSIFADNLFNGFFAHDLHLVHIYDFEAWHFVWFCMFVEKTSVAKIWTEGWRTEIAVEEDWVEGVLKL